MEEMPPAGRKRPGGMKLITLTLFRLILLLLISAQPLRCERVKLKRVPFDRESARGPLQNKVKKFEESKLVLVSNLPKLSETHGEFLRMFEVEGGNHVGKFVHLGGSGSDALLPEDPAIYDGLVIILDALDDQVVESVTTKYVISFREKKKNVFLSLNRVSGKNGVQFLTRLDIQVYGSGTYVKDLFGTASRKGGAFPEGRITPRDAFYTGEMIRDTPIVNNPSGGNKKKKLLLFQGTAHVMMGKAKQSLEVVTCTQTCLLYDRNGNVMKKTKLGRELSLVSSTQWDNNSRCVFSSSSEIFSDAFFHANGENKEFARESNFWVPLKRRDIQYELVKMEVHRRDFLNVHGNADSPTYYKSFHLPNEHGVYKIKIYFHRKGYNVLNLHFFLPVRSPLHYDKNKKVHFSLYPFYAYIYLSLFCFFFFLLVILFDDSGGPAEDGGGRSHGKKDKMD
ncbi:dolichyl-diphosphooligosaccharide--protein glycosyltransferase subunit WBP1, putative [Plasmodium vivax]|nr:dolichyl-diphosphooligosaccharide--protein glycosyltransferase subunit WBP1, putative [Plasmodium vivax]